jgi:hypothetical protein
MGKFTAHTDVLDTRTKSLLEIMTDTREHLHKDLSLMIKDEKQLMKTLIDTTQRELKAEIVDAKAWAEGGSFQITGSGTDP